METVGKGISKVSTEQVIASIKSYRDRLISSLCQETNLLKYLEENFNTVAISKVKLEFLIRDLAELKHSSLDLAHYSSQIKKMKESDSVNIDNPKLIMAEIDQVIRKYVS